MNFEEWLAKYGANKYRVTEYDLKAAWAAAIDEALKIVDNSISKSCVGITAKLKELK